LKQDPAGFRASLESWATEHKLDVLGVLTTYNSAQKGNHRRELLILVGGDPTSGHGQNAIAEAVANVLAEGLEGTSVLDLERVELNGNFKAIEGAPGDQVHAKHAGYVRLWRQRNTDATRKAIAPIFRTILENV